MEINTIFDSKVELDYFEFPKYSGKSWNDYQAWEHEKNKAQARYNMRKINSIRLNWDILERHLTKEKDETALHSMCLMISHILGLRASLDSYLGQYHKERTDYRAEDVPVFACEMIAFIKHNNLQTSINAAAYMRCSYELLRTIKDNKGVFLDSTTKHRRKWLDAVKSTVTASSEMDNLPKDLRAAAYGIVRFFENKTYSDFEIDNNLQIVKELRTMMNEFERLLHEYIRNTREIVLLMGRKFPVKYDLKAAKAKV